MKIKKNDEILMKKLKKIKNFVYKLNKCVHIQKYLYYMKNIVYIRHKCTLCFNRKLLKNYRSRL